MTARRVLVAALYLFALASSLPAVSPAAVERSSVIPVDSQLQQVLGPELEIYRDVSGKQTLSDIERSSERFRQGRAQDYFGIYSGTLWVRLTLRNTSREPLSRWLVVDNCLQEYVTLYQPQTDGSFAVTRSGARIPVADRSIPSATIVFPVDMQPGQTKSVYLAVRGRAVTVFNLALWVPGWYLHRAQQEVAIQSFATGLNAVLLLVCVFAAKGRRRWTLVLGGVGHLLVCGYSLVRDGYGLEWLQGGQGLRPQYTMQFLLALTWLCHALFVRSFFYIPRRSPWLSVALQVMAAGFGLLAMSSFLFFVPWLTALTTLAALTILTWVAWAYADDFAKRGYFVWCSLLWVGLGLTFAKGAGLVPLSSNVGLLGSLVAVVLASLVLTFSFYRNVLDVQSAAVAAQQRMAKLRRSEAARLRQAVRVKTRELGVAVETAQRAAADKAQFLAMIAHELRSPLHVILGNLQLLKAEVPVQLSARVASITRSSSKLQRLIDYALGYGAGKLQTIKPEMAVTNFRRLLADVVDEAGLLLDLKPPRLQYTVRGELPLYVITDGLLLAQVLENLLSNAQKYGGDGAVDFVVQALGGVESSGQAAGNSKPVQRIRFSVRDYGQGISSEDQERIFEPFTRLASSRHQPGQGLGLAVARQTVRAMSSDLRLDSKVGAGACFYFEMVLKVLSPSTVPVFETIHDGLSLPPAKLLAPLVSMLELGEVLSMRALAADLRQQYPEYSDYLQAIESACLAVDLPGLARLLQWAGDGRPAPVPG